MYESIQGDQPPAVRKRFPQTRPGSACSRGHRQYPTDFLFEGTETGSPRCAKIGYQVSGILSGENHLDSPDRSGIGYSSHNLKAFILRETFPTIEAAHDSTHSASGASPSASSPFRFCVGAVCPARRIVGNGLRLFRRRRSWCAGDPPRSRTKTDSPDDRR